MPKKKQTISTHVHIPMHYRLKLDQLAKTKRTTLSQLLVEAISLYLSNIEKAQLKLRDEHVTSEISRIEERLVKLLIKNMRGVGQVLYVVSQLWVHGGPPQDGLTEEELKQLIDSSKQYSYQWLTAKEK